MLNPPKLFFGIKEETKTFSNKQKPREFITIKPYKNIKIYLS